ncbi:Hkr1p Ecym_4060 [Eremothecium cymbalariae DBVPG|uniref:Uncharacterized protein n=1 Tax=Eremothecium cymbalariae (strain CBS 270.75 / DBVPG 7215 / KCTC 17166 / NRRL Y-17582) TaxID=931890 RepID=G8JSY7_ERECY|nr:hypothetical protein Ecym_4060 [Eremothecium cymbalariae DBVPG\
MRMLGSGFARLLNMDLRGGWLVLVLLVFCRCVCGAGEVVLGGGGSPGGLIADSKMMVYGAGVGGVRCPSAGETDMCSLGGVMGLEEVCSDARYSKTVLSARSNTAAAAARATAASGFDRSPLRRRDSVNMTSLDSPGLPIVDATEVSGTSIGLSVGWLTFSAAFMSITSAPSATVSLEGSIGLESSVFDADLSTDGVSLSVTATVAATVAATQSASLGDVHATASVSGDIYVSGFDSSDHLQSTSMSYFVPTLLSPIPSISASVDPFSSMQHSSFSTAVDVKDVTGSRLSSDQISQTAFTSPDPLDISMSLGDQENTFTFSIPSGSVADPVPSTSFPSEFVTSQDAPLDLSMISVSTESQSLLLSAPSMTDVSDYSISATDMTLDRESSVLLTTQASLSYTLSGQDDRSFTISRSLGSIFSAGGSFSLPNAAGSTMITSEGNPGLSFSIMSRDLPSTSGILTISSPSLISSGHTLSLSPSHVSISSLSVEPPSSIIQSSYIQPSASTVNTDTVQADSSNSIYKSPTPSLPSGSHGPLSSFTGTIHTTGVTHLSDATSQQSARISTENSPMTEQTQPSDASTGTSGGNSPTTEQTRSPAATTGTSGGNNPTTEQTQSPAATTGASGGNSPTTEQTRSPALSTQQFTAGSTGNSPTTEQTQPSDASTGASGGNNPTTEQTRSPAATTGTSGGNNPTTEQTRSPAATTGASGGNSPTTEQTQSPAATTGASGGNSPTTEQTRSPALSTQQFTAGSTGNSPTTEQTQPSDASTGASGGNNPTTEQTRSPAATTGTSGGNNPTTEQTQSPAATTGASGGNSPTTEQTRSPALSTQQFTAGSTGNSPTTEQTQPSDASTGASGGNNPTTEQTRSPAATTGTSGGNNPTTEQTRSPAATTGASGGNSPTTEQTQSPAATTGASGGNSPTTEQTRSPALSTQQFTAGSTGNSPTTEQTQPSDASTGASGGNNPTTEQTRSPDATTQQSMEGSTGNTPTITGSLTATFESSSVSDHAAASSILVSSSAAPQSLTSNTLDGTSLSPISFELSGSSPSTILMRGTPSITATGESWSDVNSRKLTSSAQFHDSSSSLTTSKISLGDFLTFSSPTPPSAADTRYPSETRVESLSSTYANSIQVLTLLSGFTTNDGYSVSALPESASDRVLTSQPTSLTITGFSQQVSGSISPIPTSRIETSGLYSQASVFSESAETFGSNSIYGDSSAPSSTSSSETENAFSSQKTASSNFASVTTIVPMTSDAGMSSSNIISKQDTIFSPSTTSYISLILSESSTSTSVVNPVGGTNSPLGSSNVVPSPSFIAPKSNPSSTSIDEKTGWLPTTIVTASMQTSPKESTTVGSAATYTLPRAITPATPVAKPDNYDLITIGFVQGLNYAFLVSNPVASAQIFSFLPHLLNYPYIENKEALLLRHINESNNNILGNRGSVSGSYFNIYGNLSLEHKHTNSTEPVKRRQNNEEDTSDEHGYSQIVVKQIVPFLLQGADYTASVAEVYFPSEAVTSLRKMVADKNSKLYLNPVATLNQLASLVDPRIPVLTITSGSSPSFSNTDPDHSGDTSGSSNNNSSDHKGGTLDLGAHRHMSPATRKRILIFSLAFSFGVLLWILIFLFLLKRLYKVSKIRSKIVLREKSIPNNLGISYNHQFNDRLSDLKTDAFYDGDPERNFNSQSTNSSSNHDSVPDSFTDDDMIVTGENTVYSLSQGITYHIDEEGNYYYARINPFSNSFEPEADIMYQESGGETININEAQYMSSGIDLEDIDQEGNIEISELEFHHPELLSHLQKDDGIIEHYNKNQYYNMSTIVTESSNPQCNTVGLSSEPGMSVNVEDLSNENSVGFIRLHGSSSDNYDDYLYEGDEDDIELVNDDAIAIPISTSRGSVTRSLIITEPSGFRLGEVEAIEEIMPECDEFTDADYDKDPTEDSNGDENDVSDIMVEEFDALDEEMYRHLSVINNRYYSSSSNVASFHEGYYGYRSNAAVGTSTSKSSSVNYNPTGSKFMAQHHTYNTSTINSGYTSRSGYLQVPTTVSNNYPTPNNTEFSSGHNSALLSSLLSKTQRPASAFDFENCPNILGSSPQVSNVGAHKGVMHRRSKTEGSVISVPNRMSSTMHWDFENTAPGSTTSHALRTEAGVLRKNSSAHEVDPSLHATKPHGWKHLVPGVRHRQELETRRKKDEKISKSQISGPIHTANSLGWGITK